MNTYINLYFDEGTGNYYTLDGSDDTVRGLFILNVTNKEAKKIKGGFWKAWAPISCTVTKSKTNPEHHSVSITMTHNVKMGFECESKYFGKLTLVSQSEQKTSHEVNEAEKYVEKDLCQIFVKHMGRWFEEIETRFLNSHPDLHYSRLQDTVCKCRQLQENNEFYNEKKKLISGFFK